MPGTETACHAALKRAALAWAIERGFRVAAAEVSLPFARARVDAAACRIESRSRAGRISATAIFECKQSRSDFSRDGRSRTRLLERLSALAARQLRLEAALRPFYLGLRAGEALFPEMDDCDFLRTGDECYLRLVAEQRRLAARLSGQTKFDDLVRWKTANLYYLLAPPGIVTLREAPAGWGLLLWSGDRLTLAARPLWHDIPSEHGTALLQRTAIAATRSMLSGGAALLGSPADTADGEPLKRGGSRSMRAAAGDVDPAGKLEA